MITFTIFHRPARLLLVLTLAVVALLGLMYTPSAPRPATV